MKRKRATRAKILKRRAAYSRYAHSKGPGYSEGPLSGIGMVAGHTTTYLNLQRDARTAVADLVYRLFVSALAGMQNEIDRLRGLR